MRVRWREASALGTVSLVVALAVPSQEPDRGKTSVNAPAQEPAAMAKPANLRVLPKDSSAADIKLLMDQYGEELGVSCDYCHAQNPRTQKLDYASDDNPAKQTARVMIAMLNEINTRYLAQLDDQKYAVLVSCGNCHRGQTNPPEFQPPPRTARSLDASGK
jgi:hypothetical protein